MLVTGSRNWTDRTRLFLALSVQTALCDEIVIVHGDATGADALADSFAVNHPRTRAERHPADWGRPCDDRCYHKPRYRADGSEYCPMAGHYRNQEMVDLGADICLAFPLGKSNGTRDCMRRAAKAGIPVSNFGDSE
ncbi:SLOG family protein [Mycobacteroides abscessus]|uniref:SLOG family protein n=1 Tax=Mycobacteroides abscessus TaxID=36809 RepID=UPI0009A86589|nr:SLOG family protein [Mycobacteroides abscessus]